jgi:site-specific recombinase XerD
MPAVNRRFTAKTSYHHARAANHHKDYLHPPANPTRQYLPRRSEIEITTRTTARPTTAPPSAGERLDTAIACFLAERDLAPSTHRVYVLALARLPEQLGADTLVGQITARRLTQFMSSSYQHLGPASWNRVVATLGSFFAYTTRQGWSTRSPAAGLERRQLRADRERDARRRAIPEPELTAFLNAEHPLREKTLWWLLYETAARANEILALNVEDLTLPRRRAVVIGKGGRAELVGWETKTARLLPRHLKHRTSGPLFLADIAPAPARQPALADIDPTTGRARLSYRRAEELFSAASGGRTLHQLRHSRLTHLAEHGIQLPILIAKTRHTSLASLQIYAHPTFDAVAAATAAVDPDRRH